MINYTFFQSLFPILQTFTATLSPARLTGLASDVPPTGTISFGHWTPNLKSNGEFDSGTGTAVTEFNLFWQQSGNNNLYPNQSWQVSGSGRGIAILTWTTGVIALP